MKDTLKMFGTAGVITLILVALLVPCISAQVHGSEEKINLPSDRIDIEGGNKKYASLIACLIESREHIDDVSSKFSIYQSDTSDNFNKKLNEYQEKLKGYQKQVGEIAIGQIVPDPKGIALNKLTHGVAGEISGIKTMADLGSIMLSISQDTVDLYKEARKGGTTQTKVAEVKQGIGKGYNSMIIQTASDAILFNEIMTSTSGKSSSSYTNIHRDIIKEVNTLAPNLFITSKGILEYHNGDIRKTVKAYAYTYSSYTYSSSPSQYSYGRFIGDNKIPEDALLVRALPDPSSTTSINGRVSIQEEYFSIKGKKPPIIYLRLPLYEPYTLRLYSTAPALYGFKVPDGRRRCEKYYFGRHSQRRYDVYYPSGYQYFSEEEIKSYYEQHGFDVPEEYKVVEINVIPQQIQLLQEIKSYTSKIPDYSTSDLYKYLNNLTDRWGIEALILTEYPVSSNGKKALEEYKSDVEYLSNLAFYSQLFVIKGEHVLTVKPNEPVIKSLINLGDFKDHVNYFENRIERNGQIAKEEYAKPFKSKATEWNTEIKELEDESKVVESKLQEGKPDILGMIFGDESYDAAVIKLDEAQCRIKETKKNIEDIEKSDEVQIEKVESVEALLKNIKNDLSDVDTHLKKSGGASALYKIARAYTRHIKAHHSFY